MPELSREIGEPKGAVKGATSSPLKSATGSVLALQRTIGNRAVAARLRRTAVEEATAGTSTPGVSLDTQTRSRMEEAFGTNLGGVRIHPHVTAADSAQRLNARAYTVGEHIAFGPGAYRPGTSGGNRLIAHEIAHVLQQRGRGAREPSPATHSAAELEAAAASRTISAGGAVPIRQVTGVGLAREISVENIMQLGDDQIESEHQMAVEWLSKHGPSDAEYATTVAYVQRLESVIQSRNPSRAKRATRRQQLVEQAVHPSLITSSVLATVGLNPTEVAIATAFVEGLEEAVQDQPPERKERILTRFQNVFFTGGSWADKARFFFGFDWGFVVGIAKEIWGILRIFYDVPKLMWQANNWFNEKLVGLIAGGSQVSQQMKEVNQLLSDAMANVALELVEFVKDPNQALKHLDEMFGNLVGKALDKAGDWGHDAVDSLFGFLEEPMWDVAQKLGEIYGAIVFNIVLLVASDAIGNVIKEIASWVTKLASAAVTKAIEIARGIAELIPKLLDFMKVLGEGIMSGFKKTLSSIETLLQRLGKIWESIGKSEELPNASDVEKVFKKFGWTEPTAAEQALAAQRAEAATSSGADVAKRLESTVGEATDIVAGENIQRQAVKGTRIHTESRKLLEAAPGKGKEFLDRAFRFWDDLPASMKGKTVAEFLQEHPELKWLEDEVDATTLASKIGDLKPDILLQGEGQAPILADITSGGRKLVPLAKGVQGPRALSALGELDNLHAAKTLLYVQIIGESFPGEAVQFGTIFWDTRFIPK